jgi:hypothetical protein
MRPQKVSLREFHVVGEGQHASDGICCSVSSELDRVLDGWGHNAFDTGARCGDCPRRQCKKDSEAQCVSIYHTSKKTKFS